MNDFKWMTKETCCPIVIFCLYLLYSQWTVSYLYINKNGCLNCTMYSLNCTVQTKSTLFVKI